MHGVGGHASVSLSHFDGYFRRGELVVSSMRTGRWNLTVERSALPASSCIIRGDSSEFYQMYGGVDPCNRLCEKESRTSTRRGIRRFAAKFRIRLFERRQPAHDGWARPAARGRAPGRAIPTSRRVRHDQGHNGAVTAPTWLCTGGVTGRRPSVLASAPRHAGRRQRDVMQGRTADRRQRSDGAPNPKTKVGQKG